jgi:hypothetical protein
VLLGKGELLFSPAPVAERGQVRVFSGSEALRTPFDACLVRINPGELESHATTELTQQPVDAADLARAQQLFADDAPRSYTLDVGDLGPGPWSMIPARGDFLAEVHTRRFGQLTYARTASEPEDVTLFDRLHRRTIALYASRQKLASRGRFFDEGGQADYTVTRYEVTASFAPERFIGRIAPRQVVMVNGLDDPQMPEVAVRHLYDAAREPKAMIWLRTGHLMPTDSALIRTLIDTAFARLPVLRSASPASGCSPRTRG